MKKPLLIILQVLILLGLSACSSTPRLSQYPSAPVDLQGRWELDADRSTDADKALLAAVSKKINKKGKKKNQRRASASAGAEGADGPPPEGAGTGETEPKGLVTNPAWIDVDQSRSSLVVNMGGTGYRRYIFGDKVAWVGRAGAFETESGWSKTDLWAESESPGGAEMVERFSLSADRQELVRDITVEAKMLDGKVKIRQVYVRSP